MIGPHEGKELELMLAGKKHLAYFGDAIPADGSPISEDIIPEQRFAPYVQNGTLKRFEQQFPWPEQKRTLQHVCFTTPGHEWRAELCFCLHKALFAHNMPVDAAFEFIVGRLLGYSDDDICEIVKKIYRNKPKKQLFYKDV